MTSLPRAMLALVIAAVPFAAGTSTAAAQQAAEAEARRLTSLFEAYLGTSAPGTPPTVTVTAEAGFYRVAVALDRVAQPFAGLGFSIDPVTWEVSISPRQDGTWRVFDLKQPDLSYRAGERSITVSLEGLQYEGVYDPVLGANRDSYKLDARRVVTRDPLMEGRQATREIVAEGRGVPTGQETVTYRTRLSDRGSQGLSAISWPPGGTDLVTFETSTVSSTSELAVEDIKWRRVMDLWAYFVANPSRPQLAAAAAELRSVLQQTLPVFQSLSARTQVEGYALRADIGRLSIAELVGGVRIGGLTAWSGFGGELLARGIAIESDRLPDWVKPLLPTEVALDAELSGLDLETVAVLAIDNLEPDEDPPLSNEVVEQFPEILLQKDGLGVVVAPGRVIAPLYELRYDARFEMKAQLPTGRATITAKGLDATIAALQAVPPAGGAGQLLVGLFAAKALAKAEPDGSSVWIVEFDGKGRPLVNGNAVGPRR
jgi:hypothetical protein